MKIKLVFEDWQHKGKSLKNTVTGNNLSTGVFHSGTTFDGEITLTAEDRMELRGAIAGGYTPVFWVTLEEKK